MVPGVPDPRIERNELHVKRRAHGLLKGRRVPPGHRERDAFWGNKEARLKRSSSLDGGNAPFTMVTRKNTALGPAGARKITREKNRLPLLLIKAKHFFDKR